MGEECGWLSVRLWLLLLIFNARIYLDLDLGSIRKVCVRI